MGRLAGTVARACLTVGIALMAAVLARAEPAAAADLTVEQIEKIVRDYLLREPKVVFEALQELQRQEAEATAARQTAAIAANQKKLLDEPRTPVGGNPDGDVTLVEFFDYRCAYCRRVVSSVRELLDEDRRPARRVQGHAGARPGFGARCARGIGEPQAGRLRAVPLRPDGERRSVAGRAFAPPPRASVSTRIGSRPTWMRPR